MPKLPKKGPEFSREREFKVILEDLQSQFRAFGEDLQEVRGQLNGVKQNLASFREEFTGFRIETRNHFSEIHATFATKKDLESFATKKDLEKAVEPLTTKKDLQLLEKRLVTLESPR